MKLKFDTNFSFTGNDLFYQSTKKYFFKIVTNLDRNKKEFKFGRIFLKKYQVLFNPDSKMISFFKKKEIKNDNKPEISNNSTFYFVGIVMFGIFLFIIGIILGRKYCKMGKKDNIYNYKKEILYELRSY